jgi:signal transduction histidine kinase
LSTGSEIKPFIERQLLTGVIGFAGLRIQQVLLNLVLKPIESCRHGDTVTLRAETEGSGVIVFNDIDPAGPILLAVTARMFDPVFTTKPAGIDLVLAIARNIARAHHGDLALKINQPGRACFSLKISCAESRRLFGGGSPRWAEY